MTQLGVGIIGCGNISAAYCRLAPMFKSLSVRAVADINMDTARARAAEFDVRAETVADLLNAADIDVVVNLTIPAVHFEVTKSILEAGKHAYSEKPLVLTLNEAETLRELAAWREEQAIKKDLPRRWLVADEVLVDMVRVKASKPDDLSNIRGLKSEQIKRHGETWLQLIQTGLSLPPEEWPELPRRRKPDADLALVADLLMLVVNKEARASNISPQMIATRSQVEKMLNEGRQKLSDDWRGSLMNDAFTDILNGKTTLGVDNLKVVLETIPEQ